MQSANLIPAEALPDLEALVELEEEPQAASATAQPMAQSASAIVGRVLVLLGCLRRMDRD
jgi:hypothetical protein